MSQTEDEIITAWDAASKAAGPDENFDDPFNKNRTFKFNFTDVKDEFELIPEGVYPVRVTDFDMQEPTPQKAAEGKFPQAVFTFEITAGEFRHKTFKEWKSTAPKAMIFLLKVFKGLGFDAEDQEFEIDRDQIVGRLAMVQISHTSYTNSNGKIIPKHQIDVWQDEEAVAASVDGIDAL